MPTPEQVRSAAENHAKLFTAVDKDGWLALYSENAEFVDPYPAARYEGREAMSQWWDGVHGMASGYDFDVRQITVAGDRAAMAFTLSMSVGDDRYCFDGVDVFQVDDSGRITQFTAYWDPAHVRPA